MEQKILLVGDPRICPQVAYVMDWQNFEQVEQLTSTDQYRDYQIVVCAFKRKSKKLVSIKDKTLKIIYLDSLCQELDNYDRTHNTRTLSKDPWPFWRRVRARIKNGEVLLAIVRRIKRHFTLRNWWLINHLPITALKLSELFLKVLYSKPTNVACTRLENNCDINDQGEMIGCCGVVLPFGKIRVNHDLSAYNDFRARVIKLSSINRSYCFCDWHKCLFAIRTAVVDNTLKTIPSPNQGVPRCLGINTDRACNLKCPMCRREYVGLSDASMTNISDIHAALIASGWLKEAEFVALAGMGEVFYSKYYQQLLRKNWSRKQIYLVSNGTLFNRANWEQIQNKFEQISVAISVDAASAAVYQKVRGGDWVSLMDNLQYISLLRRNQAIQSFELRFVVYQDNYHEMIAFVQLAKSLGADSVLFTHLNNYGVYSKKEYGKQSLLSKGHLQRELYEVLQHPILRDPIVDLTAFQPYLAASAKRYGK